MSPGANRPGLQLRPATLADVPALVALETQSFSTDRIPARYFRRFLRDGRSTLLVAEQGGAFAGYALVIYRRNSRSGRLYSLAVSASARGGGVGAALLATAEQAARKAGRLALQLEVRPDNLAALRLYEKHGYRVTGRRTAFYEDGTDALRLEKNLVTSSPASSSAKTAPGETSA